MISLYFRPADASLNPKDAVLVVTEALIRIFGVALKAANEHIPDPKVPAEGIFVFWKSATIGILPNPARPNKLQASFVRQALQGIMVYSVQEGWSQRTVEIHHDVLGYIANAEIKSKG